MPVKKGRVLKLLCETKNSGGFKEEEHPRDDGGKFTSGSSGGQTSKAGDKITQKESDGVETLSRIDNKLNKFAEPMPNVEYSIGNYKKLFPNQHIETPIGKVKMGKHQFEKLKNNNQKQDRRYLLGAMHKTLSDPTIIYAEHRDGKEYKVFVKAFRKSENDKLKPVVSITAYIDDISISFSTHEAELKDIFKVLKKPGSEIVYEKQNSAELTGKHLTNENTSDVHLIKLYHAGNKPST